MEEDIYFMNLALKEAYKAYENNEVPVGVVIVKNHEVVATARNEREAKHDITKHAELVAIKKISRKIKDWRLDDYTMYVTLYPCPMCASAIMQSRIKKLVIGAPTKDLKFKDIGNLIFNGDNLNSKIEVIEGVLEKECKDILCSFFKNKRNIVNNK